jgi:hypothetical protein
MLAMSQCRPPQLREQSLNLPPRQYHRQAYRALRAHEIVEPAQFPTEDLLVEKKQRSERLVLRRRRNVALRRQMTEKRGHLGLSEARGMAPAAPVDEALDPVYVGFLGAAAVVQSPDRIVHLLQQAGLAPVRGFTL